MTDPTLVDELCACGCGTPLEADGPSEWFADETCQRRWAERHSQGAAKPITPPAQRATETRTDPAEGERTRDQSTEAAQTISADHPSSQPLVPVHGCRHCDVDQREHVQLWTEGVGWHGWIEPTREQIRDRMRARLTPRDVVASDGRQLEPWQRDVLERALLPRTPDGEQPDPTARTVDRMRTTAQLAPVAPWPGRIVTSAPDPITASADLEQIRQRFTEALRRPPMVVPYAPCETVPVARIEMHPALIAKLTAQHQLRADPGPGLLGVPVIADDTLPPDGWRSYDRDGNLLGQHPPAAPEPTGFITTTAVRPRPAPRPPWWRRALDRIRIDRKDRPMPDLHSRNVADTNARLAAEGRCVLHNTDVHIPARYLVELPIGNVLPLCLGCCAQWRTDAQQSGDPAMQPVRITDLDLDADPS